MNRLTLRALFAAVGVCLLVAYLVAASAVFWLLAFVWHARPDLGTSLIVVVALTVALGYSSYRYGTQRLLATMNAQPLSRDRAPGLYRRLDALCALMDLSEPAVLVAEMGVPNAVALGGAGPGTVVFDVTLFRLLDADEFEAVLAHELAHLESRDSLVQTLAYSFVQSTVGVLVLALLPTILAVTGLARATAFIRGQPNRWTDGVFGSLRARLAAVVAVVFVLLTLAVRAHSRGREFHADDRAVDVTRNPAALARALEKIERASDPPRGVTSPLYVHGEEDASPSRWLSTHPAMGDRVERLRQLADHTHQK